MSARLVDQLTEPQWEMIEWSLEERAVPLLWALGNSGAGKSWSACLTLLHMAQQRSKREPGLMYALVGTTISSVKDTIVPMLMSEGEKCGITLKQSGVYVQAPRWRCKMYGAWDDSSYRSIKGANIAGGIIDEVVEISERYVGEVQRGCRDRERDRLICTANPGHPTSWYRDNWYEGHEDVLVVPQFLRDRRDISDEYIERLRRSATSNAQRERLYGHEILWMAEEGQIYVDGFPTAALPSEPKAEVKVGVDFGTENPSCALYGYVDDGALVIFDEWWHGGGGTKTAGEIADGIIERGDRHGATTYYVDPSASALKVEMRRHGVNVVDAPNDVNTGIAEVQRKIALDELMVAEGTCPNLLREANGYVWDKARSARLGRDVPLKRDDHSLDAARYLVMGSKTGDWTKVKPILI